MIAVDSSALIALLRGEAGRNNVIDALSDARAICLSAATVAETLIVARRRGLASEVANLFQRYPFEVVPVTADFAEQVADAYDTWGKDVHPAGLNFADCFAYALARRRNCPLLYVGDDFSRTDVPRAIGP